MIAVIIDITITMVVYQIAWRLVGQLTCFISPLTFLTKSNILVFKVLKVLKECLIL